MSMAIQCLAQIKLEVLDSWLCGTETCGIARDPKKRLVLFMADEYGVYLVLYNGEKIWKRKAV